MRADYTSQSKSVVGRDQVGRDQYNHVTNLPSQLSQVASLLRKLESQIELNNADASQIFVDNLRYYVDRREKSDAVGLKIKLEKSRFKISYEAAIEKKEEFAKLLLKYQEFSSAQELFAYLLSIIHDVFEEKICPVVSELSHDQLQGIVDTYIIDKIFSEIGPGSEQIPINRNHVRGMIYWLADKCFVRWH